MRKPIVCVALMLLAVALPGTELAAQQVAAQRIAVTARINPALTANSDDQSRSCAWGVVRKAGIVGLFGAAVGVGSMVFFHEVAPGGPKVSAGEFLAFVGAGIAMGAIDGYFRTPRCRQRSPDQVNKRMMLTYGVRPPQSSVRENGDVDRTGVPWMMPR